MEEENWEEEAHEDDTELSDNEVDPLRRSEGDDVIWFERPLRTSQPTSTGRTGRERKVYGKYE